MLHYFILICGNWLVTPEKVMIERIVFIELSYRDLVLSLLCDVYLFLGIVLKY